MQLTEKPLQISPQLFFSSVVIAREVFNVFLFQGFAQYVTMNKKLHNKSKRRKKENTYNKYRKPYIPKKIDSNMQNETESSLIKYEEDYIAFQKQIPRLRETEPNRFIAFRDGKVIATGLSVSEVSKELVSKGIEPSGTVIEFVAKEELHMII